MPTFVGMCSDVIRERSAYISFLTCNGSWDEASCLPRERLKVSERTTVASERITRPATREIELLTPDAKAVDSSGTEDITTFASGESAIVMPIPRTSIPGIRDAAYPLRRDNRPKRTNPHAEHNAPTTRKLRSPTSELMRPTFDEKRNII